MIKNKKIEKFSSAKEKNQNNKITLTCISYQLSRI